MLYSLVGLLIGHLLYDRLDIVIATIFMGIIYFYSGTEKHRLIVYGLCTIGILFKLMPIFFIPIIFITDLWRARKDDKKSSIKVFLYPLLTLCACAAFLYLYNLAVNGNLFVCLLAHSKRGIQLESIWASPLLVLQSILHWKEFGIVYNYGAFHLSKKIVPHAYLLFAKYTGFVLLFVFYFYYFFVVRAERTKRTEATKDIAKIFFYGCFIVLLLIVSFQRVLSPQFLIWCIPGFCIMSAGKKKYFFILTIILYTLTYLVYDIAFIKLLHMSPMFIYITFIRNLYLIFITLLALKLLQLDGRLSRLPWRTSGFSTGIKDNAFLNK